MAGRLRGWLALSWRERVQFVGLLIALPLVHGALALFGYARTRRWLERISTRAQCHHPTASELAQAQRITELAAIAGRHGLVTATCLRQSLVVHTLLRRRGLDPELKLGVRKQNDVLDAHAWVEVGELSRKKSTHGKMSMIVRADAGVIDDRLSNLREPPKIARIV